MASRLIPPKSTKPKSPLTDKQLLFVQEYLGSKECNASEAARRAGYKHPHVAGSKLMAQENVQRALSKAQYERNKRSEVTNDMVLDELHKLAFRKFRLMLDENGYFNIKRIGDLPDEILDCIDGIEVEDIRGAEGEIIGQRCKLKLVSKLGAMQLVMKHRGMLNEKVEHEHTVKKIDWKGMAQPMDKPKNIIDADFVKQAAIAVEEDKSQLDTADVPVADYTEELTELGEEVSDADSNKDS